ncbi:unnamed protein product, partial [Thlaspi arvense]
ELVKKRESYFIKPPSPLVFHIKTLVNKSAIIRGNMVVVRERDQDMPSLHIPVVDLSDPDQELAARAVVKASQEWGVFQVVNHGIPTELIQRFKDVGRQFFELPESDKEAVAKPADSIYGYSRRREMRNGRYKNVLHKTILDKEKTRMSWPVQVNPAYDMVVGPFPELTGDDHPPKFRPIVDNDYVYRKLRKLYFSDHDTHN